MNRLPQMASLLAGVLVAACAPASPAEPTQDISAVKTSVAMTVVAEITLTASAFTITPPVPPETPTPDLTTTATIDAAAGTSTALGTPLALCDSMTFDPATVDVTVPDLTQMTPNQDFVKTWKVKNDGSCAWGDGYRLVFAYGERMSGAPQPLGTLVQAAQEVEISVNFRAPSRAGEYVSAWQMTNSKGVVFGKAIYVKIVVR